MLPYYSNPKSNGNSKIASIESLMKKRRLKKMLVNFSNNSEIQKLEEDN
jgi:hypothetical protein